MANEVAELLAKIKPALDAARKVADQAEGAVVKLNGTLLGEISTHIPVAGPYISDVVAAASALDALIDAIDGIVDADAAPPPPPLANAVAAAAVDAAAQTPVSK